MNEPSHQTNFRKRQEEELESAHQQRQGNAPLEFATAEELLRHDAATVELPAGVADRLADSAGNEPPSPWWKRMFNG